MNILNKILSVFQEQQNNQQSVLQSGQPNNHQKIHYEVRGCDTFAQEYFSCGSYSTRSAAEKMVRQLEESAKTQDASLRDEFWVVEMTDEMIAERKENENRIWNEKREELSYHSSHLVDCVRELLRLFKSNWETADLEELCRNGNGKLIQEVNWQDEEDCFEQVSFYSLFVKKDQRLRVGIGVNIRDGKYFGGSTTKTCQFSGTLAEMLEWADTEKALDDCVKAFQRLISDFND